MAFLEVKTEKSSTIKKCGDEVPFRMNWKIRKKTVLFPIYILKLSMSLVQCIIIIIINRFINLHFFLFWSWFEVIIHCALIEVNFLVLHSVVKIEYKIENFERKLLRLMKTKTECTQSINRFRKKHHIYLTYILYLYNTYVLCYTVCVLIVPYSKYL